MQPSVPQMVCCDCSRNVKWFVVLFGFDFGQVFLSGKVEGMEG